jgi:hypothetical protein
VNRLSVIAERAKLIAVRSFRHAVISCVHWAVFVLPMHTVGTFASGVFH